MKLSNLVIILVTKFDSLSVILLCKLKSNDNLLVICFKDSYVIICFLENYVNICNLDKRKVNNSLFIL